MVNPPADVHLVLGGARSGKSRFALKEAESFGLQPVFVATAEVLDGEMAGRVQRHRAERSAEWITVEAPVSLPQAIAAWFNPERVLLVDCLTLWTSNLMLGGHKIDESVDALIHVLRQRAGPILLVASEVGLGIVPDNALARAFRDYAGEINQRVAAVAARVSFVAAGLPLQLK